MNYGSLKGLVETVLKTYKCPECNSLVENESNIEVIGAAGNTINIDIECVKCGKHSMVKSEVISFDLSKMNLPPETFNQIKNNLDNIKNKMLGKSLPAGAKLTIKPTMNTKKIKDESIIDLNKNLKKRNISVEDLFGNEDK